MCCFNRSKFDYHTKKKPANKSASEHRKITKPIMEKRRRARINQSLEQLRIILLEQFKECSKKSNNLEKADILELTVKYIKDMTSKQAQHQQVLNQQNILNNNLNINNHQLNNQSNQFNNHQINRQLNNLNQLNNVQISNNQLGKKGMQLIQSGFKDCKQQINQCLSKVDKKLNERLNNHLIKFEKQQFENGKFNCNQVLNLSIHDQLLANNSQANNLLLHTPSSACSSSSSNVFFPQNSCDAGSLSPGSERSLSPSNSSSSNEGPVWRPW